MNQQFSGAAAIRGAVMVMGSTYITYALGLLTSIIVARVLGPDDFGRYAYVVWLASLLVVVGNNGLTTSAIRFVSESLGRDALASARAVHGWLQRRQFACLAIVALAYLLLLPFSMPAGWRGHVTGFAAVTLCAAMSKGLFLFDVSVAKGHGSYGIEAVSTVIMSALNIVAVFVLAAMDAGLMAYLALFAAVSFGHALVARGMLLRAGLRPARARPEPELLSRLRPHLMWSVALTVTYAVSNKSMETYLLNAVIGPAAVGFFAIASALSRGGVDMLSSGLTTVLMPMMAHAFGRGGPAHAGEIMANAMRYFSCMGLLLAGVGTLLAEPAVGLLYGQAYSPVVLPLQVMILVGGLTLAEGAFNAFLSTTDNQRLRVGFVLVSLLVTAVLALLLVPRYGLLGAVAAHAISRVVVFMAVGVGITRMLQVRLPWRELGRLLASAALASAVAALPLMAWPGPWGGVAAAALYAHGFIAGTVLFGAWRSSDVTQLIAFLERYPRAHARVGGPLQRWAGNLAS